MLSSTLPQTPAINIAAITPPGTHIPDEVIIQRIKAGEINAYGAIMRRYNPRIFRVARSFVTDDAAAMDIVQEAHIKAFFRLSEFQGKSSFLAWLSGTTRHEALMFLRKYKREVSMPSDDIEFIKSGNQEDESIADTSRPERCLENRQLQRLIEQNIDTLPEKFRTVFILRAIEQFSVKETAEILHIREETVKTRYFRAKRLLRGKLQLYLDTAGMKVYEFGGRHCDIIIFNVLNYLHKHSHLADSSWK